MSVEHIVKRMQEVRGTKYLYDALWVSAIDDIWIENKVELDIKYECLTNTMYCYIQYIPIEGRREFSECRLYPCDLYENDSWILALEEDVSHRAKLLEIELPIVYTNDNCSHCGAPVEKNKTRCSYCHCDY